jgi:hypothetical protein
VPTSPGCAPAILLKARPVGGQVADRLAPPRPDGLELYLDVADLQDTGWVAPLRAALIEAYPDGWPPLIVEGPLRSLDGEFFDVTRSSPADLEVVHRLVGVGRQLGAVAANIHCINPSADPDPFRPERRERDRGAALEFLKAYADACRAAGLIPQIENVPPVVRMREGRYLLSTEGLAPDDLRFYLDRVPGLRLTLDLSHAGLFVNGLELAWGLQTGPATELQDPVIAGLLAGLRGRYRPLSLDDYVGAVGPYVLTVHISNADGLLGEGLPYRAGRYDLDQPLRRLRAFARYFVTETIEPDPERAVYMREVQARLLELGAGILG